MNTKSIKIKKETLIITLETSEGSVCNLDRYKVVSLALLNGFYDSLRRYSKSNPIDLDKLSELKSKYEELINEVISELDLDVEEIASVK